MISQGVIGLTNRQWGLPFKRWWKRRETIILPKILN